MAWKVSCNIDHEGAFENMASFPRAAHVLESARHGLFENTRLCPCVARKKLCAGAHNSRYVNWDYPRECLSFHQPSHKMVRRDSLASEQELLNGDSYRSSIRHLSPILASTSSISFSNLWSNESTCIKMKKQGVNLLTSPLRATAFPPKPHMDQKGNTKKPPHQKITMSLKLVPQAFFSTEGERISRQ
jgi:hypothetical protein